jgi:hypothetical protein
LKRRTDKLKPGENRSDLILLIRKGLLRAISRLRQLFFMMFRTKTDEVLIQTNRGNRHLIRQPAAATFPSRGRLDELRFAHDLASP